MNEYERWIILNDLPWTPVRAAREVASMLGLVHENWMQDWPLEVSDAADLEKTVTLAEQENRREYLAAILTVLIARLDEAISGGEEVESDLLLRSYRAIIRFPEVMNYWLYAHYPEDTSIDDAPANNVAAWFRTFSGNDG